MRRWFVHLTQIKFAWSKTMTNLLKSSFLWQFAGGFLLGAVGLFALHPGQASAAPTTPAIQATR